MGNEDYHVIKPRSSLILRAAAREIAKLRRFEFAVGDEDSGLALGQLGLYLVRLSEGLVPFTLGPSVFLDGLRISYRRELRRRRCRRRGRQAA